MSRPEYNRWKRKRLKRVKHKTYARCQHLLWYSKKFKVRKKNRTRRNRITV